MVVEKGQCQLSVKVNGLSMDQLLNKIEMDVRKNFSKKEFTGEILNTAVNERGVYYAKFVEEGYNFMGDPSRPIEGKYIVARAMDDINERFEFELSKNKNVLLNRSHFVKAMTVSLRYGIEVIQNYTYEHHYISGKLHRGWRYKPPSY